MCLAMKILRKKKKSHLCVQVRTLAFCQTEVTCSIKVNVNWLLRRSVTDSLILLVDNSLTDSKGGIFPGS